MKELIENQVEQIFCFLDSCIKSTVAQNIVIPEGLELKGIADLEGSTIQRKVQGWSEGTKYLEFKVTAHAGLYIRLNKSHFDFEAESLTVNSPFAFSFYHRKRKAGRKDAQMTLICNLLPNGLGDKIQQHINAIPINNVLEKITDGTYSASQSTIPTLKEFLPTYESIMYLENPNTVNTRVQLIENQFSSLFHTPVNYIRGAELIAFMKSFERKRTAVEIQEDASRFTVGESTMKGYIGGIRGLIQRASGYSDHPFDICQSIYCDALKFKINDDSDKYLTKEEIKKLIESLAKRDRKCFKESNKCYFTDYLTPLILLCLSTGLRPKYALRLKWSNIDFEHSLIIIKGDNGKIKKDKTSELTDEAVLVLKEWKKHVIHQKSQNNWVFPSPQTLKTHLTSYKTAFTTFRNEYGLENVVMYDTRHTFATYFTSAYQNIHTTQDALHHACPKSTKRYARHLKSDKKEGTAAFATAIPSFAATLPGHAMNPPQIA